MVQVSVGYEVDKIPEQRVVHGITAVLNKAIIVLITNLSVLGCDMKYSRQLKSHLLFGWEVFNFLWKWWTLGGLDEQNIEGVHPRSNQLKHNFGNSRLAFQQKHVFLRSSCSVTQRLSLRK